MPATNTSPNVDNYYSGKGIVSIQLAGATGYRDIGNVPEFEFEPSIERLDHFSSRTGVKTKDRSVIIQKSGKLRVVMDEWTADNLSLVLLGTPGAPATTTGIISMDIMSVSNIIAAVRFVGSNDIGPRVTLNFPRVNFAPSGALNPISDEWGSIEVEGEVEVVNGIFGTMTWAPGA